MQCDTNLVRPVVSSVIQRLIGRPTSTERRSDVEDPSKKHTACRRGRARRKEEKGRRRKRRSRRRKRTPT